jgi:tRNA(Ile)-lysidine synthase
LPSEARALFADLVKAPALVLAVSGGPDSVALLVLAARWRAALRRGPQLVAVTVDHGLRPEAAAEARAVRRLARKLGVRHRILRWTGTKPSAGLQEAARNTRYRLLAEAARRAGARHIVAAHTRDDQAETVLFRLARGSGVAGLGAMAKVTMLPASGGGLLFLVRPLLDVPKARLIATLRHAKIAFADDPSNRDPRFMRSRLRALMPDLAKEGLDARRLSLLAQRMRRADAALEEAVDTAAEDLSPGGWSAARPIVFDAGSFSRQPAEVRLRLLGRAIAWAGDEGPVELGKLETLAAGLNGGAKGGRLRRTLAGALVTLTPDRLVIERAPPRRQRRSGSVAAARRQAAGSEGRLR